MPRHLIAALAAALLAAPVAAQDESFEPKKEKKASDREVYQPPADGQKYHKVVLVPYNPTMHLSDADPDIVQYSGMELKRIHGRFRAELNVTVAHQVKKVYKVKDLLMEDIEDEEGDLQKIYNSIGYRMEQTRPAYLGEEAQEEYRKTLLEKVTAKKEAGAEADDAPINIGDAAQAETYVKPGGRDSRYLAAVIGNSEIMPYLANKYQADLFVFINQLEIRTNYASCLDLARKVYERELRVHFTVFDRDGNVVMGDVAVIIFPSSSNDIGQITASTYPLISEYIARSIPQPRDTEAEKKEDQQKRLLKFGKKVERKRARQY